MSHHVAVETEQEQMRKKKVFGAIPLEKNQMSLDSVHSLNEETFYCNLDLDLCFP